MAVKFDQKKVQAFVEVFVDFVKKHGDEDLDLFYDLITDIRRSKKSGTPLDQSDRIPLKNENMSVAERAGMILGTGGSTSPKGVFKAHKIQEAQKLGLAEPIIYVDPETKHVQEVDMSMILRASKY